MPFLNPGHYSADFNQTLPLLKFERFGTFEFFIHAFWHIILILIAISGTIFVYKYLANEYRKKKLFIDDVEFSNYKYRLNRRMQDFIGAGRYIADEFKLLGDNEKRRHELMKDLLQFFKRIEGFEELMMKEYPESIKFVDLCRNYLIKK